MMPEWRLSAMCLIFYDLPWIEEPSARTRNDEALMARVCASCPVRETCLAYVEEHQISAGFWAGCGREPHEIEPEATA